MGFDLKTAVPVVESENKKLDVSNGFDITTATLEPKEPIENEVTERQSFVGAVGDRIMAGLYSSAGGFNKLIGLGAFEKTEELFITSSFDEADRLRSKFTPKNKVESLGLQFADSLGQLAATLPLDVMTGGATKIALSGKVLPQISILLSRIPDFAIGLGLRGLVEGVQEKGTLVEKTVKGAVKGAEGLAFGTIYGSISRLKIPTMAAIGGGNVAYEAFKEGRVPTQEEVQDGIVLGAAYGTFFSLIPFLQRTTKVLQERPILKKAQQEVVTLQNQKNLRGIKDVFARLSKNKKLRSEVRESFRLAKKEIEFIEARIDDKPKPPKEGIVKPEVAKGQEIIKSAGKFGVEVTKPIEAPKVPVAPLSAPITPIVEGKQALAPSDKAKAEVETFVEKNERIKDLRGEQEEIGRLVQEVKGKKIDDVLRTDIAEEGFIFKTVSEFKEAITQAKQRLKDIKQEIKDLRPDLIARRESTIAKKKLSNIKTGIREGAISTRKEVKLAQTKLVDIIERQSGLDAKDKAKFLKTIKNIQTVQQLNKSMEKIVNRVEVLAESAEKRVAITSIRKELKTTKPLKVGQKRVGKFDFETNKVFDNLREFNKLTQEKAQAEFDKFPEDVTSEIDLIKKRFLSLKANGTTASAEIHNQVLADIKRIKELGKLAKDQADLEKRLNRQEIVDSALGSIDKIKADKKTIKTKIGNAYRKGFSNIGSMLNSIGGKEFAETFDPELSENRRGTATYEATRDLTVEASKIYNENNVMRLFESMSRKDYKITDVADGLTTDLSKLELVDIFNSLKNDKKKQDYFEAYGEDQVTSLLTNLTQQDESFADALQESVQGYREILNKRNIEITGRDLGFIENYWPATSEFKVSVLDDIRVQGETPSALKERAKGRVIPVPKNAWYKAQKHISQSEHVDKVSRSFEGLKRLFTDRKVKHAIEKKFGEGVYRTILTQIDNLSLNKQSERIDAISSVFQKAINNWVTAKIALNPSTYVRQLMSVGNYAELMNPIEWTTGFFEGIASPKKTFEFVWKNAPFLEARFKKGFSEALKEAIDGAESISVNKAVWTKGLTSLVRSGDVTAIIYGGFPLIKSELAKHGDMQRAIDVFEKATLKSQQSGLSSSVSEFQNSRNPFTRLFLAFKNTSNQYFRKQIDAIISFQNNDISAAQLAKTTTIYSVIQPILYVTAGALTGAGIVKLGKLLGLRDDDEEDIEEIKGKFLNDVITQLVVSPVNAIPVIDDAARSAVRALQGESIYKIFSTPLFDDLEKLKALTKKEVTLGDYLDVTASILEPSTGTPVGVGIRTFEKLTGKDLGKKKKKGRQKIGR